MSLQKQVNIYFAKGKAGMKASDNPVAFYPRTTLADKDGVVIGNFCWMSAEDGVVQEKVNNDQAPLGFVFGSNRYQLDIDESASVTIKEGQSVDVALKGDFYAVSTEAVTKGMAVYASETDGSIKCQAEGNIPAGYKETGFHALEDAEANEPFIIEKL
mgnify:CR=1 FL=1